VIDWEAAEQLTARPAPGSARAAGRRTQQGNLPGETGIWVFVAGDLVAFSMFFMVFMHERGRDVVGYDEARQNLVLTIGLINTIILLTGSLLVVAAVAATQRRDRATARRMLFWTLLCGFGFMGGKVVEYSHMASEGLSPADHDFYMYFVVLTGIHLFHLTVATCVVGVMLRAVSRSEITDRDVRTVESGGIFWHLVDLLWLVLFSLFYLVR
jgi:nitric oxide reductase NorE protein